jgi:proteasome lid subunit RPN8/RPN11
MHTTASDQDPSEVLFSQRAHAAICAETMAHHPNETGGILLGHCIDNRWQVLEAIDPGPEALCTATTFSYDQTYVNHLAAKLARQYRQPLQLIGLWHRHPGSFDRFSSEDDITNRRFAKQSAHGALSCLVNLDPTFRLTAYHVPQSLRYRQLPTTVGDGLLNSGIREHLQAADLNPERLADQAFAQDLQLLFQHSPRDKAPLEANLAAGLDGLLERLDQQQRWRYGIKACGSRLQLALVERNGPARQLWELQAPRQGWLSGWRKNSQHLQASLIANLRIRKRHAH